MARKSKTKAKPDLWEVIEEGRKEAGMTMKALGDAVGIGRGALWCWRKENKCDRSKVVALLKCVGVKGVNDAEAASAKYAFTPTQFEKARRTGDANPLARHLNHVHKTRERARPALKRVAEQCAESPLHMSQGDYLISITATVLPFLFRTEQQEVDAAKNVASAIGRGAMVAIVTPDATWIDACRRDLSDADADLEKAEDFVQGFEALKRFVTVQIKKTKPREDAEYVVATRLGMIPAAHCQFFTPGFIFTLLGHTPRGGATKNWVVIRPPFVKLCNLLLYPEERLLESRLRNTVVGVLSRSLNELNQKAEKTPEAHRRKRFVEQLHALLVAKHTVTDAMYGSGEGV